MIATISRTIRPLLRAALPGLVLLIFTHGILFGQTGAKGAITGTVTDDKTNDALPGVNVSIKGTYYGAVTDPDGKFTIRNVNPGSYTLEVSLLGYKKVQFTDYKIASGETKTLNLKLEETVLSLGQEVLVIGERPLFNIEETQSTHTIKQEDVKFVANQSVQNIVSLQTGVVQTDDEVHIRGGRSYENAYLIDGVSVQDPLAGTGFGLQVSPSAIKEVEVITGGYNAEYGQATSGIVNITTKEGSSGFTGSVNYKRDHFGFNGNSRSNDNTDVADFSLSGREPITMSLLPALGIKVPGEVTLFATANMNITDAYTRWTENVVDGQPQGYVLRPQPTLVSSMFPKSSWLAPRDANAWSWLGKATWKPSPMTKFYYTYTGSILIDQSTTSFQTTLEYVEPQPGFQFNYLKIPDSALTATQYNVQHAIGFVQTLSNKAFLELKLSRYSAHVRGDANGKSFQYYLEPKDIVTLPVQYYNTKRDTIGVIPGDGFYDIGGPTTWRDHSLIEWSFKGDLTYNFTENQKFKTGFETRFQDIQMVDINSPWYKPLGLNNDVYNVSPALGAVYAQDALTMRGLILNVGLRLDYWFPGYMVDSVMSLPPGTINVSPTIQQNYFSDTYDVFGRRMKMRLSPRLGISHPVSDNQTMFFSYGHFSKIPRPQFVYAKLASSNASSTFQTIGNPDLNPETTVSYELGLRNQLSGNDVLTLTAYYKDIFDYITARTVNAPGGRYSSGTYTTYVNQDYSRIRGFEAEYITRVAAWLHATVSGSYSIATGKSSQADEAIYNLQQGLQENIRDEPMSFDRPLQASINLSIGPPKNQPFFGFGKGILEDYALYLRFFYQSGKRYTPQILYGYDISTGPPFRPLYIDDYKHPYSAIGDPWFYIDLNFEKYFNTAFGKMTFSIEVQNLLDRKNSQIVNPVTGRAYEYGDPTQSSVNDPKYPDLTYPVSPYPYNGARYLTPRTIRFGIGASF